MDVAQHHDSCIDCSGLKWVHLRLAVLSRELENGVMPDTEKKKIKKKIKKKLHTSHLNLNTTLSSFKEL